MVYETKTNLLGHPLFLARKNVGIFNFVSYRINLNYRGAEYSAEDAVAVSGVKKAFFMLGVNDLGYQTPEEATERYEILIDRIREKNPDVELYLQTCPPRYAAPAAFSALNDKIDAFNLLLLEMAQRKGCHVIDLAAYLKDHTNGMVSEYALDYDAHLNYEGSVVWMNVLRAYAYAQLLEEEV